MSPRALVPLCVALGAATSCTGSDTLVDDSVTGGFTGNSGGSSLHVTPDGVATRTSREGTQSLQLDSFTLTGLKQKIADAQFPSLAPEYPCPGCADELLYEVTVQLDGHSYSTRVEGLDHTVYPESLKTLLTTLDEIAVPPR